MATVLVTGGAGFIGCNLTRALVARGDTVRVFDDLSSGYRSNLEGVDAELIVADIRDRAALDAAMVGVDYVLHQAAMASVSASVERPIEHNAINIDGTLNVLESARQAGVKRLVFAASAAAYGDTEQMPVHEGMRPRPLSPYGVAKVAGEHYIKAYHEVYGFEAVALRYFNIFGPRQDPASDYAAVIPIFVNLMLQGKAPRVNGDGLHSRDFCFVDNVVEANLKALEAPDAPGNVYNIGVGTEVTLLELIDGINAALGTSIVPEHGPERPGDVRKSLADISAARRDLGYTAAIGYREGLARTLDWYKANLG